MITEKEYQDLSVENRKQLFAAKLSPIHDENGYRDRDVRLTRNALRTLVLEADARGWWPTAETLRNQLGPEELRRKSERWLDDYCDVRLDTMRLVRALALGDEALIRGELPLDCTFKGLQFVQCSCAAVMLVMDALAEEPQWDRLCTQDVGMCLMRAWLEQAIFFGRDVQETLECLRRYYTEHVAEPDRLTLTYCAYCVWRGWRAGLEIPAFDRDPFALGCRLVLAGNLAGAHKLLFKFGDEGYHGDFATSLLIHSVCMAVKPSISRAVKIMRGDYYHSLDRFDDDKLKQARYLQDLHADIVEIWSKQWGADGALTESAFYHSSHSLGHLAGVLRFAWDWHAKDELHRVDMRDEAKNVLPLVVRAVESGYVNLGGLFLSLVPEMGAEPEARPILNAMKESGTWMLPFHEPKPIWSQFLASLGNMLGVTSEKKPRKSEVAESESAVGRIVWELKGQVSEDGYVRLSSVEPCFRCPREDGTEESMTIQLHHLSAKKYRSIASAQDLALGNKMQAINELMGDYHCRCMTSNIVEEFCLMPNLELIEESHGNHPKKTPVSIEARPCQMDSSVSEDGTTVLSLPAWRYGDDYALMTTERPGVLAFVKLNDEKRKLVNLFNAYGQDGKIVLPPEAVASAGAVLERLGDVLPAAKPEARNDEELPEVKAKVECVVRLEFDSGYLAINVLMRPVKGTPALLFEPGFGPEKRQVAGEKGPYLFVRDVGSERALFAPVREALGAFDTWFNGRCSWQIGDVGDAVAALDRLQTMASKPVLEWNKDKKLQVSRPKVKIASTGERRGWFDVKGSFTVDNGKVHDIMELLVSLQGSGGTPGYVRLTSGEYVLLTQEIRRQLGALAAVGRAEKGALRIARGALPFLATTFGGEGLSLPAALEKAAQKVRVALAESPEPPKTLAARLRPYQLEGYRWLSRLASCGFGSCLADDMGLGKTLQTIALLLERAKDGASLVVAPASVCGNWRSEIRRFAPTLEPIVAMEEDEETIEKAGPRSIVIASYGYLLFHEEIFRGISWNGIVLDEAQAIKNEDAKRTKLVKEFKSNFRVAATGTPVENRIEEFWSIMDFLNPGLRGSIASVKPLILRRLKGEVLDDLPEKTEVTRFVELSVEERSAYEACRLKAQQDFAMADKKKRMGVLLAGLTRLRRFCCNPSLVLGAGAIASAKLEALAELMEELREGGHRALVFSQFTDYLAIVRKMVKDKGWNAQYLDGETPLKERGKRVDAFQNGEGDFFLISLKAGGTGLNLTAADYVIILDPWWNPAVENQAADRAHRIGQRRPVTIYRLIATDTVEERVLDLHREKLQLSAEVLDDTASASLTGEELLELLK